MMNRIFASRDQIAGWLRTSAFAAIEHEMKGLAVSHPVAWARKKQRDDVLASALKRTFPR
jgi:hypothetical protein